MHSWKPLFVLFCIAVIPSVALAQVKGKTKTEEKSSPLQEIEKKLKSISDSIASLKKDLNDQNDIVKKSFENFLADMKLTKDKIQKLEDQAKQDALLSQMSSEEMAALKKRIENLEGDVSNLKAPDIAKKFPDPNIKAMKKKIAALEKQVAALKSSPDRIARSSPQTGSIALVNNCGEELLFIVNGTAHRVDPFSRKKLSNQLAGPVNYEVIMDSIGSFYSRRTSLRSNSTLSIIAEN